MAERVVAQQAVLAGKWKDEERAFLDKVIAANVEFSEKLNGAERAGCLSVIAIANAKRDGCPKAEFLSLVYDIWDSVQTMDTELQKGGDA